MSEDGQNKIGSNGSYNVHDRIERLRNFTLSGRKASGKHFSMRKQQQRSKESIHGARAKAMFAVGGLKQDWTNRFIQIFMMASNVLGILSYKINLEVRSTFQSRNKRGRAKTSFMQQEQKRHFPFED